MSLQCTKKFIKIFCRSLILNVRCHNISVTIYYTLWLVITTGIFHSSLLKNCLVVIRILFLMVLFHTADPQSRPVMIILYISKCSKINPISNKIMFTTDVIVCLAEWIIYAFFVLPASLFKRLSRPTKESRPEK